MAQNHVYQDNPSVGRSKAGVPSDEFDSEASGTQIGTGSVIALGTNAWVGSVGWTLLPADVHLRDAVLASTPLAALLIGAMLHVRKYSERASTAARWLLLCVYPAALAAALCLGSEAVRERVHSPLSMSFCAVSLLAYCVAAVLACREPLLMLPRVSHVRQRHRDGRPAVPQRLRQVVIGMLLVGGLAIAVVAPLLPPYIEVEAAWGGAAEAGAVLAAIAGGALGVAVIAIHLGAVLHGRPLSPEATARERRTRVATLLFLAGFGLLVYFWVLR